MHRLLSTSHEEQSATSSKGISCSSSNCLGSDNIAFLHRTPSLLGIGDFFEKRTYSSRWYEAIIVEGCFLLFSLLLAFGYGPTVILRLHPPASDDSSIGHEEV